MPKDLLKDGTIIYQFADLTPSGSSSMIGISCQTTIGDASATKVREFQGTASLDYATQNGNAVNSQNTANINADSTITSRKDEDFYALGDSELSFKNKVQPCLAMFPLYKTDDNSAIFTTYSVKLGARIYTDKADTAPTNLGETTIDVTIDEPVYENDWSEYDDFDYEEIEVEWKEVFYNFVEVADTQSTLNVPGYAYAGVYSDIELNKMITVPNFWNFYFYVTAPSAALADGSVAFNYVTMSPSSGDDTTIGCATTVGAEGEYKV